MDFLGDVGGILDLLIRFFGIFLFPLSEANFYLSAIKKLFVFKTSENSEYFK
jgi:hypothetical protein